MQFYCVERVRNQNDPYDFQFNKCSNIPLGLQFDQINAGEIPWRIIVHFSGHPATEVVKLQMGQDAEKAFTHSMKQAIYLLSGNTRLFTSLSIQQHIDIIQSVKTGELLPSIFPRTHCIC